MNDNKKIYIMVSFTGTILSRLVKIFTRRKYSHSSVSLDKPFNELFSFGRLNPYNPVSGGFVKEEITAGTYKRFKHTICRIYELEVTQEQYDKLKTCVYDFYENKEYYKFNIIGLITVMFNKPVTREHKYFCSQFVSKALLDAGIHDFNKDIGLVKPIEFETIPNLVLIYEGKLQEYPKQLDQKN